VDGNYSYPDWHGSPFLTGEMRREVVVCREWYAGRLFNTIRTTNAYPGLKVEWQVCQFSSRSFLVAESFRRCLCSISSPSREVEYLTQPRVIQPVIWKIFENFFFATHLMLYSYPIFHNENILFRGLEGGKPAHNVLSRREVFVGFWFNDKHYLNLIQRIW